MPSTASTPLIDHPSVFEVLNLFRARWFLNREHLLSLTLSAVKGGDNNDSTWIDLLPSSHTHLLRQAKNLAPPSYPLPLLKRVMFTFLLEVINSRDRNLDQFIKTSAPRRRRAPTPVPSPPPVVGSSASVVEPPASPAGLQVQDTRPVHSGTDTPVAPMAVDPGPLPPATGPLVTSLSDVYFGEKADFYQFFPTMGAAAYNQRRVSMGFPPLSAGVIAALSRLGKRALSPPPKPLSPPPPAGLPLARAPPDWRAWITQRRRIQVLVAGSAADEGRPITPSDLVA